MHRFFMFSMVIGTTMALSQEAQNMFHAARKLRASHSDALKTKANTPDRSLGLVEDVQAAVAAVLSNNNNHPALSGCIMNDVCPTPVCPTPEAHVCNCQAPNINYCNLYHDACNNHGTCTSTADGYTCECEEGYDGNRCEFTDVCNDPDDTEATKEKKECGGRGTCMHVTKGTGDDEDANGWRCQCDQGWSGSWLEGDTEASREEKCDVDSDGFMHIENGKTCYKGAGYSLRVATIGGVRKCVDKDECAGANDPLTDNPCGTDTRFYCENAVNGMDKKPEHDKECEQNSDRQVCRNHFCDEDYECEATSVNGGEVKEAKCVEKTD